MVPIAERPDPRSIELDARSLWKRERLPPPSGILGPSEGPIVHLFEGSFAAQERGVLVVQRAVAADVDARSLLLRARRVTGVLRLEPGGPPVADPPLPAILHALGVWVGGDDGRTTSSEPRREAAQTITGRLAHAGVIVVRDVALRTCPACAVPRDPERIVYQEESGETLIVRFPFRSDERTVSALVWTDAAWRLLGASAILLHPERPYVLARYRRDGADELVLTSRSSLDRLRQWRPGAEIEVLEEHPGKHWEGAAYVHPLLMEFPMGGSLEPPAGTILAAPEVSDAGTGIVPLVPGHGGTDAAIAERIGVPGWPLLTPKGRFDIMLIHKYAGVELDSGDEFVVRDLDESDAIFARVRAPRGVPHCARCGTALIWAPGRAWCLEPARLPATVLSLYRTLRPTDPPIERLASVPWPVSEPATSDDPLAIVLLECTTCERLEPPGAEGDRCGCGGRRRPVRRRLLPSFEAAAGEWGRLDPFPPADAVRIYLNDRRHGPALVHHLAAMSGVAGSVTDVRLSVLPTPPELDLGELVGRHGADAVRAALVRSGDPAGSTSTIPERCAQEQARIDRFLALARALAAQTDPTSLASLAQPVATALSELEPEDRALLARFEHARVQCLADFERGATATGYRRFVTFLESDLADYRRWTEARRAGIGPTKRAALRTLLHVVLETTFLLAPVVPHSAEAVHGTIAPRRVSVFEETVPEVDRALLDEARAQAWDRWSSVLRALEEYRRTLRVPPETVLPVVAIVLRTDAAADAYRPDVALLERLGHVGHLEIASPGAPWSGRRRQLRPVEAEIQRVYASRSAQIIHLLRRTTERKALDPGGTGFTLTVNGQPVQILPSMVEWAETVPERVVPVPWGDGELYVETPTGVSPAGPVPPPLSPDAFAMVERVRHRLRTAAATEPGSVVVRIEASPALSSELRTAGPALVGYLGVREVRLVANGQMAEAASREFGRERGGQRWAFELLGAPMRPARSKPSRTRRRGDRVRPAFAPASIASSVPNYAEDEQVARLASMRALGEELDQLLGVPLIGPSKVVAGWDAGLRSMEDYRNADWTTLIAIPGIGVPIATLLVEKFGRTPPPRPPRPVRVAPPAAPVAAADASHWTEPSSTSERAAAGAAVTSAAAPAATTPPPATAAAAAPAASVATGSNAASPTGSPAAQTPAAAPAVAAVAAADVAATATRPVESTSAGGTAPAEGASSPASPTPSDTTTPNAGGSSPDRPSGPSSPDRPREAGAVLAGAAVGAAGVAALEAAQAREEAALVASAADAAEAAAPSGIELSIGTSYVPALERFLEATAAGHLGVCVVRDSPERVRAYAGSRPVEIRWLTNLGRGATIKPTDLDGYSAYLDHAVTSGRATAFLLEGLEYLVRLHGLDKILERLQRFDEVARAHAARAWVSLNPQLLSAAELERFQAAFPRRSGPG